MERITPTGYQLIAKDERYGFEVWGTMEPRIVAMSFGGKRSKPDWHYRFKDMARLQAQIASTLDGFMQHDERKAERKAKAAAPHDVKIGDIFRSSWGYDQTNIDYYECTQVIGAMIEIRAIAQLIEETDHMQGKCTPSKGHYIGEPMRKKVNNYNGEPSVKIYSFASAYRVKPIAVIESMPIYAESHWTAYA
jgi:hypothetical protein